MVWASKNTRRALREIMTFAAAGPAAFTILGAVVEKLHLSEVLVGIILRFDRFQTAVWYEIYMKTGFALPVPPALASGMLFLLLPTALQVLLRRGYPKNDLSSAATMGSAVFIVGIASDAPFWPLVIFSVGGGAFAYWDSRRITRLNGGDESIGYEINSDVIFWSFVSSFVVWASVFTSSWYSSGVEAAFAGANIFYAMLVLPGMAVVILAAKGATGPLYAVVFAIGVYVYDLLSRLFVSPFVDWLVRIGVLDLRIE